MNEKILAESLFVGKGRVVSKQGATLKVTEFDLSPLGTQLLSTELPNISTPALADLVGVGADEVPMPSVRRRFRSDAA